MMKVLWFLLAVAAAASGIVVSIVEVGYVDVLWFLLTFACGTAYELGCVFWTHFSEQNKIIPASLWSIFNAGITCLGLGAALHRVAFIVAYALGFGAGTAIGIKIKQRWKKEVR